MHNSYSVTSQLEILRSIRGMMVGDTVSLGHGGLNVVVERSEKLWRVKQFDDMQCVTYASRVTSYAIAGLLGIAR